MPGKPITLRDRIDHPTVYAEAVTGPVPDYLLQVARRTHLMTIAPQMMSGHLQGRLLALLSTLHRPLRILEIGTFTGYGTLCLAEGLAEGGCVHTIEGDPEMAYLAREHFQLSPYADRIRLHVGQARTLLTSAPAFVEPFDLVYLDGDKRGYPEHFLWCMDHLVTGGLLLADNVLWDGKVGTKKSDRDTKALQEYNRLVFEDERLSSVVLPLRDGLSVARRTK